MSDPRYTDLVASLPASVPFIGPEEMERNRAEPFRARLGANESVFGPSPFAVAAMQDEAGEVWKYGDSKGHDLTGALAAHLDCARDNIVLGEGIDGLLGNLVRLLVSQGTPVVTSDGAYPTFNYHVAGFGGVLHRVPYRDDAEDLPALIERARDTGAPLVYFANPDNPMGTIADPSAIERALDTLPEGTLLALDEAYIEFASEGSAPRIDPSDPRVLRLRTFSKAYGMAGARIGYGIGAPGLIRSFDKVRNHFGVNRIAMAGALAALEDETWLEEVQRLVEESKTRIARIAQENGLRPLASATNFVAIDCGQDGAFAKRVLEALVARGVFVRMPFADPQNRCIRVSAGLPEELDALAEALPKALAEAKDG